jgi:hypothetical protein
MLVPHCFCSPVAASMLSLTLGTKFLNLLGSESLRSLRVSRDFKSYFLGILPQSGASHLSTFIQTLLVFFYRASFLPFMSSYARRSLKIYFGSQLNWVCTPVSLSTFEQVAFMNTFGRTPSRGLSAWYFHRNAARAVA